MRDDHADGEARTDRQCRRDVELAADDLLSGLVDTVASALAQGTDDLAFLVRRTGLRTDAEQRRERGSLEQFAPVIIDTILQAGIALRVCAWLAFQHDRTAVRENQPVPDEQDTALTETDAVVILSDDARALFDNFEFSLFSLF